ncbi:Sperm-tail PG-rich repeat-containing protein 2, partial [Rhizophlyctis rosea]
NYDTEKAEKALERRSETGNAVAVMTLAPCVRLIEGIEKEERKKATPGPGAYQIKTPIEENLSKPKNRIRFGGTETDRLTTINREQLKTPGPGSYYPEYAQPLKPQTAKPQPFGSTTDRFDDTAEYKTREVPAPGSYDVDEVDSIVSRVHKRVQLGVGHRSKAFGSISDRFPRPRTSQDPGPGAYDPSPPPTGTTALPPTAGATSGEVEIISMGARNVPPSRIAGLLRKGPTQLKVGNLLINPAGVHVPVFGTQEERFVGGVGGELPPPGAYEVANAFENLQKRVGAPTKSSAFLSQMQRELFPVKEFVPGPGEYIPLDVDKREMRRRNLGGFLSTNERFQDKPSPTPGPGTYLGDATRTQLVRRTFNITLTDWGRRQQQQQMGRPIDPDAHIARVAVA